MVSVALVATGFVSLLVLQRQNVAAHGTVQRYTIATMVAEDRLERMILKAQGFEQIEEYNEELEKNYPDYEVESEITDVGPEVLPVVMLLPQGLTLRRVSVQVTWTEGKKSRVYKLEHFVTQKLE